MTYNGNKTKYLFSKSTAFDWTDYSVTISDITDPTLRIYCYNRDASLYVSDIMVTEGAIPRKWTPAPNEIYTSEVKIDKWGIEVSNNACNGVSKSSTSNTAITVGRIAKSGSVSVTLTVTDSRGYMASVLKTITVIAYAKPKLSSVTLRRTNEIEAEMQLNFNGSISAISVDGTQKNSVQYVRYRYKKTSETSYSGYYSILSSTTRSGTSFSFSNLELCNLDAGASYDFHLQIQDRLFSLSSLDVYFVVPHGTPLIALRKKKVGINTPNPQARLDVGGDMRVNGSPFADFVIQQGTSGIWTYRKWKRGSLNAGAESRCLPQSQIHGETYILPGRCLH
ncbi:MAG: hypothetical protein J6B01_08040 [Ruminococcus sp.]|nr:hypothetical protein [Ruminococcus sp.]